MGLNMKKEYKVGEDLFLALGTFFIAAGILVKIFGASFRFGLTVILPRHFIQMGALFLLFTIALNVQELTKK